jgi:hypothetical protein
MADTKISALPASTTPLAGTEVLPIVQSSTTKQVSVANLTAGRSFDALGMTLTSTDAAAAAAPLLELYRDSASPAASDTIGEIEFNGKDSAGNKQQYALIHGSILSPTSTTEQGQIHFETATAGALTEKMIIGTTNLVINEIGAVFNVRIEGDADANLFYTDATNDRIGVGTISPSVKFEVSGAAKVTGTLSGGTSGTGYSFSGSAAAGSLALTSSGNLLVGNATSYAGKVQSWGAVTANAGTPNVSAIDTTSMVSGVGGELAFIGQYTVGDYAYMGSIRGIKENGTDNNTACALTFSVRPTATAPQERLRISSDGIVTMSAYGAGAATFSAAGVISSVSDETWKIKDGVPTNPDEMIQKLEPGYWFYNEEKAPVFGQDRQLGFYAQNVHSAIGEEAAPTPETYIETDEDGNALTKTKPWGYYDRSVLAVTVMSLKNALNTISSMQKTIGEMQVALKTAGVSGF